MKILIVEDEAINVKVLKFHIESFLTQNIVEKFHIDVAENGLEAIGSCLVQDYDVMFLDVRMPKCDGIKVLNIFKEKKFIYKPYICMVTALGEDKYKKLFKLLKANSYIIKPFDKEKVEEVLLKVAKDTSKNKIEEENFLEQVSLNDDFDDFFDFDDEDEIAVQTPPHEKVSAKEFLNEYENLEYILEDVEEIDNILDDLINSLDIDTLDQQKDDLKTALEKYITFLNSLISFHELSTSLNILIGHIEKIDIYKYDDLKRVYIIELLRAILQDISFWKEHVFIDQDAQDVHYITASVLSNCDQLERTITK